MRRGALALVLVASAAGAAAAPNEWSFRVLLDDRPIGQHRFSLSGGEGGERTLRSDADFAVKILGLTAYRYRHQATEQWQGDCLRSLTSTTDDDGKPIRVRAERGDGVIGDGCLMSFAYWNRTMLTQTRLLNAQTGRIDTVTVRPGGSGTLAVRGEPVAVMLYRITGAAQPIDLWYTPSGDWVGLDSVVAGGRKLSYRLF